MTHVLQEVFQTCMLLRRYHYEHENIGRYICCFIVNYFLTASIFFTVYFGDIAREKNDFDVVGNYVSLDVFKLTVNDYPLNPFIFSQGATTSEKMDNGNV